MSSTSSTEKPRAVSAAEVLASRYRHLFVLPSFPALLVYGGLGSLALSVISRGAAWMVSFVTAFAVLVLSATAISSAIRIVDRRTIATFRRSQALLLAGELLWLLISAVGATFSLTTGSPNPLTNAILFGAFVCAGFEFIIIEGAFEKNVPVSLGLLVAFPLMMRRRKTSVGHDSLSIFQAFMKTWAAGDADDL